MDTKQKTRRKPYKKHQLDRVIDHLPVAERRYQLQLRLRMAKEDILGQAW